MGNDVLDILSAGNLGLLVACGEVTSDIDSSYARSKFAFTSLGSFDLTSWLPLD